MKFVIVALFFIAIIVSEFEPSPQKNISYVDHVNKWHISDLRKLDSMLFKLFTVKKQIKVTFK